MKKLLLITLLLAPMMASANHFSHQMSHCSAYGINGVWAFAWGRGSHDYQCNRVRRFLLANGAFGPLRSSWGYFDSHGINRVWTSCRGFSRYHTGTDTFPLDSALRAAQFSGASYCLFRVN